MIFSALNQICRRSFVKYFSAFFFGLVLISGVSAAQEADNDIVNAHPAMWQVEKGDSKTYLLGSFHILPKNYRWYQGIIQKSFESADELVMEVNMTPEAMGVVQNLLIKNANFITSDTLKNHLDAAHYQKYLEYAKKLMGLDEAVAQKIKPWFASMQLSVIAIMLNGMDPESGVDSQLRAFSIQANKTVSGLETVTEQMSALIDHPLEIQAAMLSETLDQLDDFKSVIKSYLQAWASGDTDKIAKTMLEDMKAYQGMYEALIINRNKNWLPAIERHLNSGKTTFIVVGAAHLVGQDGIIKMLRDKGYKVDKIL